MLVVESKKGVGVVFCICLYIFEVLCEVFIFCVYIIFCVT